MNNVWAIYVRCTILNLESCIERGQRPLEFFWLIFISKWNARQAQKYPEGVEILTYKALPCICLSKVRRLYQACHLSIRRNARSNIPPFKYSYVRKTAILYLRELKRGIKPHTTPMHAKSVCIRFCFLFFLGHFFYTFRGHNLPKLRVRRSSRFPHPCLLLIQAFQSKHKILAVRTHMFARR